MATDRPARFRDVFAVGQFRILWLANVQSRIGDQLARVALSVLVYDRTGSPAWTALTYAMTILPNLIGGALLAGLADRFARRAVMVIADVVRAVLVAVMGWWWASRSCAPPTNSALSWGSASARHWSAAWASRPRWLSTPSRSPCR